MLSITLTEYLQVRVCIKEYVLDWRLDIYFISKHISIEVVEISSEVQQTKVDLFGLSLSELERQTEKYSTTVSVDYIILKTIKVPRKINGGSQNIRIKETIRIPKQENLAHCVCSQTPEFQQ